MHWVVQENICNEAGYVDLIRELERQAIPHSVHKVVPFSGELIPEAHPYNDRVWCMGSLSMRNVAEKNKWFPGVVNLDLYDQERMIIDWKHNVLNADARICTIQDIYNDQFPLYLKENFVRPVDDSKFIKGSVMSAEELHTWAADIIEMGPSNGATVTAKSRIVVARTKPIAREARFWVVKGRVVTWSLYKLGNTVLYSRNLVEGSMANYADFVAHENWKRGCPVQTYCLDIAQMMDGGYRIIEMNNLNSSGLYDANVGVLVDAIQSRYTKP